MFPQKFIFILLLGLLSSCGFLNSGNVSIKYTEVRATYEGRTYHNKRNLRSVSISARSLQHPTTRKNWTANFRLAPSIHYDRATFVSQEQKTLPDGSKVDPPEIKTKRLSTLGNLKLTLHTTIGAFVLTGGYGLALMKMEDGLGLDTLRTRDITKLDFVYVGFLSKRVFVLMGPRFYHDGNTQLTFAFRIGYYWGEVDEANLKNQKTPES